MELKAFSNYVKTERKHRGKLWPWLAEPDEINPVLISTVKPGTICRLWWMPLQTRFVVLRSDKTYLAYEDGMVQGCVGDALVVVLSLPPDGWSDPSHLITEYLNAIANRAWAERLSEVKA